MMHIHALTLQPWSPEKAKIKKTIRQNEIRKKIPLKTRSFAAQSTSHEKGAKKQVNKNKQQEQNFAKNLPSAELFASVAVQKVVITWEKNHYKQQLKHTKTKVSSATKKKPQKT